MTDCVYDILEAISRMVGKHVLEESKDVWCKETKGSIRLHGLVRFTGLLLVLGPFWSEQLLDAPQPCAMDADDEVADWSFKW